jgi:hypothetical protein
MDCANCAHALSAYPSSAHQSRAKITGQRCGRARVAIVSGPPRVSGFERLGAAAKTIRRDTIASVEVQMQDVGQYCRSPGIHMGKHNQAPRQVLGLVTLHAIWEE